jgi:hypothetical protein
MATKTKTISNPKFINVMKAAMFLKVGDELLYTFSNGKTRKCRVGEAYRDGMFRVRLSLDVNNANGTASRPVKFTISATEEVKMIQSVAPIITNGTECPTCGHPTSVKYRQEAFGDSWECTVHACNYHHYFSIGD